MATKSYKAQGIVLHSIKYGESGAVVYILTNTLGRQSYLVQGIKSARSKGNKQALFQPMFLLEFEGIDSSYGELHRMKDIRNLYPLCSVPFDVRKSTISLFMAEALYRLIKEIEANAPLFNFVCEAVQSLDKMQDGVSNFHLWFLVRMSYYLGFFPGNEYRDGYIFDIEEGVFTGVHPEHKMSLTPENSLLLARLMHCRAEDLHCLQLSRAQRSEFLTSILTYFGYHLDGIHQVKSLQILKEVF